MKKILISIAAIALMLTSALSCSRYESVSGDPLETQVYTLDNGLKVFMSVNKETPRIQTYIAVKVGGKNDPSETTGLAHYFEHLMFKGTEQFGTSDYAAEKPLLDQIEALFETYRKTTDEAERAEIYRQIDAISYEASKLAIPNEYDKLMSMIGADGTNAWTSHDETVYTEDIPSNQIDNWAKIQADRFRNCVIRGFHTELETIYEEKNMSLTQDNRKMWEALDNGLFPNHPYGNQTVLGTQDHLKNPSITNVKKYHDTYYVPNNIAICVAGDFDPDEMVETIEKYFGDWEPNPEIPTLQFEPEQPITTPVEKEVFGLQAEMIALGWRTPAAREVRETAVAEIAGQVLYNQTAGLIDLNINQQQKALYAYAGTQTQPDYSSFVALGAPKQGQTLDDVKALLLEEVAKLRAGEFEEEIIPAIVNNIRLSQMKSLESNEARAHLYVDAFINGIDWKVAVKELDQYKGITKKDVVEWANKYLADNAYVAVYKRQGEDKSVKKISAPKITPIESNRDKQSDFLKQIAASEVMPIEPLYVDFSKEMSEFKLADNLNVLYKQNTSNDLFDLEITVNTGSFDDSSLNLAFDYISYLGTPSMSSEELASRMYALGCDYRVNSGSYSTTFSVSGLGENMAEALALVEDLLLNAVGDDDILAELKADELKSRADNITNQRSCFSALQKYLIYGPELSKAGVITNSALMNLTSDELLAKVREVFRNGQEISYYGPMKEAKLKKFIAENHKIMPEKELLPERFAESQKTPSNEVYLVQYDAKQLYYFQLSNNGECFDADKETVIDMYNQYFGGGMNGIVFQEMREARGLAYSASAYMSVPSFAGQSYRYSAFIATQNDKMRTAIEAFDEIINNMPQSEAAFSVAKNGFENQLRTARTVRKSVLSAYKSCRRLGLDKPMTERVLGELADITLDDITAYQQENVKGRTYKYGILGDIKDLDTKYLLTLGPVKVLSINDIFCYE